MKKNNDEVIVNAKVVDVNNEKKMVTLNYQNGNLHDPFEITATMGNRFDNNQIKIGDRVRVKLSINDLHIGEVI